MARVRNKSELTLQRRLEHWRASVAQTYFELELDYLDPERFRGKIETFDLGGVSMSLLDSDPLHYHRLARHVGADSDESFLLTVPESAPMRFSQRGRTTICAPGSFTLERSSEPYEFSYDQHNLLRVLKIPASLLRRRIGSPENLCAMRFDSTSGAGALFTDYLELAARHAGDLGAASSATLGAQLLDLLGIVLDGASDLSNSHETSVQAAHLRRVERHIRVNLSDHDLTPTTIAEATGLSVRYLHKLFKNTERTLVETVRELRLEGARETLHRHGSALSLSEVAYEWGFSDQSHFCRVFKSRFGISPGESRRQALDGGRSK